MSTAKETIEAVAAELGITMTTTFVPWSRSRNAKEKDPSLNWIVTLAKDGRDFLTTDYMAGMGHCPAYKQNNPVFGRMSVDTINAVKWECEHGRKYGGGAKTPSILPELADVMASLVSDASVIDSPTYEDWASEYGYDPDSRSGERIYRACLETALKMRSALGDDGMNRLREACQDY